MDVKGYFIIPSEADWPETSWGHKTPLKSLCLETGKGRKFIVIVPQSQEKESERIKMNEGHCSLYSWSTSLALCSWAYTVNWRWRQSSILDDSLGYFCFPPEEKGQSIENNGAVISQGFLFTIQTSLNDTPAILNIIGTMSTTLFQQL